MEYAIYTVVTGIGATALLDVWTVVRRHAFGTAPPNYAMVGRWLGHMVHGRFRHAAMGAAEPVGGERLIGWTAHYATGVGFAAILPAVWGRQWLDHPTLAPAMVVGIGTVLAPFLVMQPGMGAGIFASRTPRPNAARTQSLVTHAVFGLGLYAAAWIASLCCVQ